MNENVLCLSRDRAVCWYAISFFPSYPKSSARIPSSLLCALKRQAGKGDGCDLVTEVVHRYWPSKRLHGNDIFDLI